MLVIKLFRESLVLALHALLTNKLRTALSLLGITIGIFAIISVFTAVDSLEMNVRNSIESLGNDVVFIQKWPWGAGGGEYEWWEYWKRPNTQLKELAEIQKKCTLAEACAFVVTGNRTIKYKSNHVNNVEIMSVSHDYDRIVNFELETGRYFSELESANGKSVIILGSNVAQGLFENTDPIGKNLKIAGIHYTVIGVFKQEGESITNDTHDNKTVVTVNSVRKLIAIHKRHLNTFIMVKAKDGVTNDQLKDNLRGLMRSIRKTKPMADDNFSLNEISIIAKELDKIFSVISLAGWLIGGFSILVGGFGIANIMFVSVKERTNIIGIQKALGAKNYFILLQFLFESILLCLIGGLAGLTLVYLLVLMANSMIDMTFSLTFSNIGLGIFVSGLIGIISGFIPAFSASKLDPVVAIRSN